MEGATEYGKEQDYLGEVKEWTSPVPLPLEQYPGQVIGENAANNL